MLKLQFLKLLLNPQFTNLCNSPVFEIVVLNSDQNIFESSLTKSDFTFKTKTFTKFFPSLDRQKFFYGFRFQNYGECDGKMRFFDNFLCEEH